jgi:hypothetical protein
VRSVNSNAKDAYLDGITHLNLVLEACPAASKQLMPG